MKKVLIIFAGSVALLLSACEGLGNVPTPDEVGGILGLTANQIVTSIGAGNVVSRIAGGDTTVSGSKGGTAAYVYGVSSGFYSGTVVFDGFTVEDPDGNVFTIDGSILLDIDTNGGLEATFIGSATIAKNGSQVVSFSADVLITITVDGGPPSTITVDMSGTINGIAVSETTVYSFS